MDPESGRIIGRELGATDGVTAIFCGNDEIAMGVIRGLREVGKSVPGDISVVGFDDHPLAAMWNPPLTTVRQDFANLGVREFDLLGGSPLGPACEGVLVRPPASRNTRERRGAAPVEPLAPPQLNAMLQQIGGESLSSSC